MVSPVDQLHSNPPETDNVTEIRVWVNGTPSVGGSNFTLYASSDNASFGVPTHNPSGLGNGVFAYGRKAREILLTSGLVYEFHVSATGAHIVEDLP